MSFECCPQCGFKGAGKIPGLSISDDLGALLFEGQAIHMSDTERDFLGTVLSAYPRPVQLWAIYESVWNKADSPQTKIIDVYACKIRKKLVASGLPLKLEGVARYSGNAGYRLVDMRTAEVTA